MKKRLHAAGVSGFLLLLVMIPLLALSVLRQFFSLSASHHTLYLVLSIFTVVLSINVLRGFRILGSVFGFHQVAAAALFSLLMVSFATLADMLSILFPHTYFASLWFALLVTGLLGISSLYFGSSLLLLQDQFGFQARVAAFLEMTGGIFLLIPFLSLFGVLVLAMALLAESVLLLRASHEVV